MPESRIHDVAIRGIACAVPRRRETEKDLAAVFGEKDARRLVRGTTVQERRLDRSLCCSDLCQASASELIRSLNWDPRSIKHLVFVTQSSDYLLPATACVLQDRLGLDPDCSAFDVNLGCSGYTYGLWLAGRIVEPGQRALLLVGDTPYQIAPEDRSALPLFGAAGAATALESTKDSGTPPLAFFLGTDGSGYRNIFIPAGHCRTPHSIATLERTMCPDGIVRSQEDLYMNGPEVFAFSLNQVPPLVDRTLNLAGWTIDQCDDFVFHQANGFMLQHLSEKIGIPATKVPKSIELFGNTSSASIPLTMVTERRSEMLNQSRKFVLAGFGVGWSWAGAAIHLDPIVVPELIEMESAEPI